MTTKLTPQTKKVIRKVTEALKDSMISMTIDDLVNATGSSPTVIKNTLSKIEGVKQDESGYYLPRDDHELNAVAVNIQEAPVNMQDKELNTQAPQVSYPDNNGATLINTPAILINPSAGVANPSYIVSIDDLHPEFAQLPDYQSSNGQAIETTSLGLASELKQLDNAYLDGLASKAEAPNAEVSQAIHPEFFGGDKVYVLNAGSPYIHEINWVENNQLGTVHFKDSMDSRSQKWLLPATKENHAKLCALMPWIEWQRPELVGSDLMLKILEDDEVWLCRVGNDGDENCSFEDIRLVVGQHDEKGFFVAGRGDIAFKNAVPVNVHGAPLTESDVFGAAQQCHVAKLFTKSCTKPGRFTALIAVNSSSMHQASQITIHSLAQMVAKEVLGRMT